MRNPWLIPNLGFLWLSSSPCNHGNDCSFVCVNSAPADPLKPPSTFCQLPLLKITSSKGVITPTLLLGKLSVVKQAQQVVSRRA